MGWLAVVFTHYEILKATDDHLVAFKYHRWLLSLRLRANNCGALANITVVHFRRNPHVKGGSIGGDPHVQVYDDVGYDCHGQGEFVVTKAAATDSEVQARFQQWGPNPNPGVTVTTAVAAREGTSSVIQATSTASSELEVRVDGELYDETAGTAVTGVALELQQARVEMRFPSGLEVFVLASAGGVLRVEAYVPLDLATTGLLGNNNGNIGDDWKVRASIDRRLVPKPAERKHLVGRVGFGCVYTCTSLLSLREALVVY